MTNDNITIIGPNSSLITNPVTNWSYGDPKVRLRLPVSASHGSDVEKLQQELLEMAAANPSMLKEPASQRPFSRIRRQFVEF
jgi:potassium-dependent mechanosensitive channel